jgi:hypothetical protein
MTVGVTDGSIIANIITAHIASMKIKSVADHAKVMGYAKTSIDLEDDPWPR